MGTVDTIDYRGLRIRIHPDPDPMCNPRDNDNLGTMLCFHRRYSLGDDKECERRFGRGPVAAEAARDWLQAQQKAFPKNFIWLPLYLYDHGSITISTSEFHDPWDSGPVGFIYVDRDRLRTEYLTTRITAKIREQATAVLKAEVDEYDRFIRGEVYGYTLVDPDAHPLDDGDDLDSCWGFIGFDYTVQSAKEAVDHIVDQRLKRADAQTDANRSIN